MIVFRFSTLDHLALRFAISPVFEVLCAVGLLRAPAESPPHATWANTARERLAEVDFTMLDALVNDDGYTPDFFSPPPSSTLGRLNTDLEQVLRTPREQVEREVSWRYGAEPAPSVVQPLLDDPSRGLETLVGQIGAFWEAAIAPDWPAILSLAQADITYRARRLAERGSGAVFDDLDPDLHWRDGDLYWRRPHDQSIELDGRGLLLVPVIFQWPKLSGLLDHRWQQPAVVYAPRGIATLWQPKSVRSNRALGELMGRRRAEILIALDEPDTTSQLAFRLDRSLSSVSEHLSVLRRCGLVSSQRDGLRVLYTRTEDGTALLRAANHDPERTP